jgi:hypothetical protein
LHSSFGTLAALRRDAALHRLLTAAPVSLCEFVESSLALSCCGILTDREILDSAKAETGRP